MTNPLSHEPTADELQQMGEQIKEMLGDEAFERLSGFTYCYRIMTSMYYCNSIDRIIIAADIYSDFNGTISLPHIQEIVDEYLPQLLADPDVWDGMQLNTEIAMIAQAENARLQLGKSLNKKLN